MLLQRALHKRHSSSLVIFDNALTFFSLRFFTAVQVYYICYPQIGVLR